MYRILLVEDDNEIAELIKAYFDRRNEMVVEIAFDGIDGEGKLFEEEYDLALLDVMMPGLNGFEVCEDIRSNSDVPFGKGSVPFGKGSVPFGKGSVPFGKRSPW